MTAVLASLITGVFTFAAALIVLFLQQRHQRDLALDARIWDRRAEVYVDLLQYQGQGVIDGYRGPATGREWAVRDELTARAAAFASDAVRDLWQQSARASQVLQEYVRDYYPEWGTAGPPENYLLELKMEEDPTFCTYKKHLADASDRLIREIRAELGIPPGELAA